MQWWHISSIIPTEHILYTVYNTQIVQDDNIMASGKTMAFFIPETTEILRESKHA